MQVDVDNIQASSFNEKEKDPFSFTLTHLNSDYGKNCIKEVRLSFYDSDGLLKWVESDKKAIVSNVKNISSNKITIVIITNNIVEIKFENDWYLSLDTSDPLNLNIVYSKNSSINTRWLINDEKDYFSISHTNGSEKFKYLNIEKMILTDKIANECKIYVK